MKIWELEAQDGKGNSNVKALSELMQRLAQLEVLRKDVKTLGDIEINSYSSFDAMVAAISPVLRTFLNSKLHTMGYAKIDSVEVLWRGYWCKSCRKSFVMPWEMHDTASVVLRDGKVKVKASTPAEAISRMGCCDNPHIVILNKAEKEDNKLSITYNMNHPKDEPYVVWTIPFSLAQSFSKIIENEAESQSVVKSPNQPGVASDLDKTKVYLTMIIIALIACVIALMLG